MDGNSSTTITHRLRRIADLSANPGGCEPEKRIFACSTLVGVEPERSQARVSIDDLGGTQKGLLEQRSTKLCPRYCAVLRFVLADTEPFVMPADVRGAGEMIGMIAHAVGEIEIAGA